MLIGIDGNEANMVERVGVHQYAYHLLWGLKKLNDSKRIKHTFRIFLKDSPKKDLPKQNKHWIYKVIPGSRLWILRNLMPTLIQERNMDVFFSPSHYLPPLPLGLPKICTIHDLGFLRFSEQFKKYDFWQLKLWTAISVSISKYIIAVSNFTKQDIVRQYKINPKKIFVTHHGYDKHQFNSKIDSVVVRRVLKKYHLSTGQNYILFLSTLKPSKNIDGLITAFKKVKEIFPDLILVIAGKKGWMFGSIFESVKVMGLEKDIIFTGYLKESDKPALIKGAKVFVSPSFWEGFGIHVLEAMACGVPVVTSKVASLPEVVGSAGVYVNPKNVKSISSGIKKVLNMNKNEYNRLTVKVLSQSKKFSWEKAAKKTMEVFEKASCRN